MTKAFLIDAAKCSGCRNCQVACKDEFCEQPWLPYSEAQPLTGSFWMNVKEKERGQVPVVTVSYTPVLCGHCDMCALELMAPDAVYRRKDGLVIIDPAKARGRRDLVDACPLGAVYWNEALELPQKCTGCAHLLDDGWSVPRCVDSCAHEAILFGEEDSLDLEGAQALDEVASLGAHVYYKNLAKRFCAGCVYDPEINDVIEGATVQLVGADGSVRATSVTDFMGDWKFDQIDPASYVVRIQAQGYDSIEVPVDVTEDDVFAGDAPMKFKGNPAIRSREKFDPPRNLHSKERTPLIVDDDDDGLVHLTLTSKIRDIMKYPESRALFEEFWPPIADPDIARQVSGQNVRQLVTAHLAELDNDRVFALEKSLGELQIEEKEEFSTKSPIAALAANPAAKAAVDSVMPGFLDNEEIMGKASDKSMALIAAMMPGALPEALLDAVDAALAKI